VQVAGSAPVLLGAVQTLVLRLGPDRAMAQMWVLRLALGPATVQMLVLRLGPDQAMAQTTGLRLGLHPSFAEFRRRLEMEWLLSS
jgi:hypothetical protein